MAKLEITDELYRLLKTVRSDVQNKFNVLRVHDSSEDDIGGKGRLERVPALTKRNFGRLTGSDETQKEKAAWLLLDFLRGVSSSLPQSARRGLRSEVDGHLAGLRQMDTWVKARTGLEEALKALERHPTPTSAGDGETVTGACPAGTPLWRQITSDDYSQSPEGSEEEANRFVSGWRTVDWWTAQHVAYPRSGRIGEIYRLFATKRVPIVVMHGPIGQGKSVLLRQFAHDALSKNLRVFELFDAEAFADERLVKALQQHHSNTLLVADDILLPVGFKFSAPLAVLLKHHESGALNARLLMAVQTRFHRSQLRLFDENWAAEYRVPDPDESERSGLVATILKHPQPDTPDEPARIRELIDEALEDYEGGLWPSMYAATHGEGLEDRMRALVRRLAEDADESRFIALAAVVFCNGNYLYAAHRGGSREFQTPLRRSLVEHLIGHVDYDSTLRSSAAQQLCDIGQWLERELLDDGALGRSNDPPLILRHPAVTDCLYRWIYGAHDPDRGKEVLYRWRWYLAWAHALAEQGRNDKTSATNTTEEVMRVLHAAQEAHFGIRNSAKARRCLSDKFDDLIEPITDIVLDIPEASPATKAMAFLWKTNVAPEDGGHEHVKSLLNQALKAVGKQPPPSILIEIADTLERRKISLMTHDGKKLDWRKCAAAARTSGPTPIQFRELFKIVLRSSGASPDEFRIYATESEYFSNPDYDLVFCFRHFSDRWTKDESCSAFPDFCRGKFDAEPFQSLAFYYLAFWRAFSDNERWVVNLESRSYTKGHTRAIFQNFLATYRDNPEAWPHGTLAAIEKALKEDDLRSLLKVPPS